MVHQVLPLGLAAATENIPSPQGANSLHRLSPNAVFVSIMGQHPAMQCELLRLLRAALPDASILSASESDMPPDIVLYSIAGISADDVPRLQQYHTAGAMSVAIADSADDIPPHLRTLLPMLLYHPLTLEGFVAIIEPIRNHLGYRWFLRGLEALPAPIHLQQQPHTTKRYANTLTLTTLQGEKEFAAESIVYFSSERDETVLYRDAALGGQPTKVLCMRIGAVEERIRAQSLEAYFLRVHKSHIVNLHHVSGAHLQAPPHSKDLTLQLSSSSTCPCSRTYKNTFHQAMVRLAEREGGSWKKQGGLWKRG
jgi:hypothetical protein